MDHTGAAEPLRLADDAVLVVVDAQVAFDDLEPPPSSASDGS